MRIATSSSAQRLCSELGFSIVRKKICSQVTQTYTHIYNYTSNLFLIHGTLILLFKKYNTFLTPHLHLTHALNNSDKGADQID